MDSEREGTGWRERKRKRGRGKEKGRDSEEVMKRKKDGGEREKKKLHNRLKNITAISQIRTMLYGHLKRQCNCKSPFSFAIFITLTKQHDRDK